MNTDLVAYYRNRAAEYEKVYAKPHYQRDLTRMTAISQDILRDKTVLEIACGTGWWTERIARTARSVYATDINQSVLDIAAAKDYPLANVVFSVEDVFEDYPGGEFDALLGGFIWSHILLERLDEFLERSLNRVQPGGIVIFADSRFVPDSSTAISQSDSSGNTWQTRRLEDGSEHLVLKNFPTPEFLREKLPGAEVVELEYFWLAVLRRR